MTPEEYPGPDHHEDRDEPPENRHRGDGPLWRLWGTGGGLGSHGFGCRRWRGRLSGSFGVPGWGLRPRIMPSGARLAGPLRLLRGRWLRGARVLPLRLRGLLTRPRPLVLAGAGLTGILTLAALLGLL